MLNSINSLHLSITVWTEYGPLLVVHFPEQDMGMKLLIHAIIHHWPGCMDDPPKILAYITIQQQSIQYAINLTVS